MDASYGKTKNAKIRYFLEFSENVFLSIIFDSFYNCIPDLGYEVKSPEELKGGEYEIAVDCSGFGPAMESAIPLLSRGGRLCVFGVANPKTKVTFEPYQVISKTETTFCNIDYLFLFYQQMYKKELNFVGVNINPFTFPKGLGLLSAMAKTYLQYDNLGIKVFKLSEYKDALEALKKGTISKAVFKIMWI